MIDESAKIGQERKKINILTLQKMKAENIPVSWITAYNVYQSRLADQAKIDMLLVGDSMGMVELGYDSTIPVTMEEMIIHTKAVVRGNQYAFVIGDMPFMSYQISDEEAIRNAGKFIAAGADAVKCEGGSRMMSRIRAMSDAGIAVQSHLGLTPQNIAQLGGYKIQGKTQDQIDHLIFDAKQVEMAGAFSILLEAMPPETGKQIHDAVKIPVYGIGAGPYVDGQLLIFHDLFGLYDRFTPKFAKRYKEIGNLIFEGLCEYNGEVKNKQFPSKEFWY